ncbi:cilia- and flagella-associated protein 36-like [Biomphalaria glabrata]|uniref:Cilia- and flagella-associated protein 36 n=1 Tax=Biomphalaria glabrata TaxID=6526 RepID=A0A2C9KWY2_BIOGL|nr:cilia- and flagella-associated protein 36-like [Biomphalaria glabrata]KAI8787867.1 cilia- and flagella-associated protein 36 [Biomphalaria glabrata]
MASSNRSDYVLDELVCFLSNPFFQIPVLSFMESKCLVFDPSVEDSPTYREIHAEYNKVVDFLLEGFRTDTGLTHEEIIKAMKSLNSKPDMDFFQTLSEQVLATVDYPIFVRIMAQKNLELQQQALMLISQMLGGSLPDSLREEDSHQHSQDDDEVLIAVLAKSKEEFEREKLQSGDEEEELRIIIGISKAENFRLQQTMKEEEKKLQKTLQKSLRLSDEDDLKKPSSKSSLSKSDDFRPTPEAYQPKKQTTFDHSRLEENKKSNVSSAQAAADWMKSAETDVKSSDAHSKAVHAAAASMAGLSEEEYKKRAEFLRKQRDKLMEMKQQEREKQLLTALKTQPQRPASARAARAALKQVPSSKASAKNPEDEKKLAMRKAIADRIKSELLNKE